MDADQREMYERGAADAEHDSLNSFYYQHYYYYRKGYNDVRRQLHRSPLRLVIGSLLALGAALLLGYALFGATRSALAPNESPAPSASTARTSSDRNGEQAALQVGQHATVVNTGAVSLRLRAEPRLDAEVVTRLEDGERVLLLDGPVAADGYTWWQVEHATGTGWGAAQGLDGVIWLLPAP